MVPEVNVDGYEDSDEDGGTDDFSGPTLVFPYVLLCVRWRRWREMGLVAVMGLIAVIMFMISTHISCWRLSAVLLVSGV